MRRTNNPRLLRAAQRSVMWAVVLLLLLPAWSSTTAASTQEEVSRAAVEHLFAQFSDAFNRHDAAATAAVCAPDIDYIVGDGSDIRGRQAVEDHMAPLFASRLRGMHRSVSLQEVRLLRPDVAVLIGYYETIGAIAPNGDPSPPTKGVYDWVAIQAHGRWQIAMWHEASLPVQSHP